MKWLNYHHLFYFREVANSGSISKASKKLLIGQPAISAQIKQFEEELQMDLFERKNRKLTLTDAGKFVHKYAEEIGLLGQELLKIVQEKSFTKKNTLRIGVQNSIPHQITGDLLEKIRSYDECSLNILNTSHSELTNELIQGNLDFFISNLAGDISRDINMHNTLYGQTPISIYGTGQFRHCQMNFPQSINGMSIILPTHESKLRHDIDYFFNTQNIKIYCETETQDSALIKYLACKGSALAVLPDIAVLDLIKDDLLYKIGALPKIKEDYWIISSQRTMNNPIITKLIQSI